MSKHNKKAKFEIPNPLTELNKLDLAKKFTFGEAANRLNEVKQHKPVFAFDYISLNNSDYCFNSHRINAGKDYQRIFQCFKNISNKSYDELSTNYTYHFHEVDFSDTTISQSSFLKCLVPDVSKINLDNSPSVIEAISLLKSLGCKILKPVNQFEEV